MQQIYQTIEQERNYESKLEYKTLINELQSDPSRILDSGITYWAVGDCSSCPECVCADFLKGFGTAAGIAASTPVLLVAKAAWAAN